MKIEIPETKKFVHQLRIPIRWGDMDAMNHVNNTVYFRYLEIGRMDWMQSLGRLTQLQAEGPVVASAFCNFYKQLAYPGELLLKLYVSDPRRTSLESWATIERVDQPGVICAAGGATIIWVDFQSQKATTLPDWLRQLVG